MRQDAKRTAHNKEIKDNIRALIKNMRRKPDLKTSGELASILDKAVKIKLIHKNKAARLKSRLSKLLISTPKPAQSEPKIKRPSATK